MLFMKRYMCNIADMCLDLGVDDRDDDVQSGRGEYWPHDVAASLSSLPPTLPRTAGKGEGKMEEEEEQEEEQEWEEEEEEEVVVVVGKEEEKEDIHHERPGGRQGWAGGAQLHS